MPITLSYAMSMAVKLFGSSAEVIDDQMKDCPQDVKEKVKWCLNWLEENRK